MEELYYKELLAKIISSKKDLLFLDTCCILDIIRGISRQGIEITRTAYEIKEEFRTDKNQYFIVIPSVVVSEWEDNRATVQSEVKGYIHTVDKQLRNLIKHYNLIFNTSIEPIPFLKNEMENHLFSVAQAVFDLGIILPKNGDCICRAYDRVEKCIAPAAKGKNSVKDCVIFEELIFFANILRERGYSGKIVFASSNTKEYYLDTKKDLKPNIQEDLLKHSIDMASTLDYAHYLVQNQGY